MSGDLVKIVDVLDSSGNTLFAESGTTYVVPEYQRAFAWGTDLGRDVSRENEVLRLMDDIAESNAVAKGEGCHYYIGSLVVSRVQNSESAAHFEVIDGQQRLTAMYVILQCLNAWNNAHSQTLFRIEPNLEFPCRPRSAKTILHMDELVRAACDKSFMEDDGAIRYVRDGDVWLTKDGTELEPSICNAVRNVVEKLEVEGSDYVARLIAGIKCVRLYRTEVPQGTDLNRYFEVMNASGIQLEATDVVKARMMEALGDPIMQAQFARIWNACRDMTGCVQMHFRVELRNKLFGHEWNKYPSLPTSVGPILECDLKGEDSDREESESETDEGFSILDALRFQGLNPTTHDGREVALQLMDDDDDCGLQFKSIVAFPHFLLHVLKVFRHELGVADLALNQATDERKIASTFDEAMRKDAPLRMTRAEWAWRFLECLLRCRYVFDRYIIKRDYRGDVKNGVWCLCGFRNGCNDNFEYFDVAKEDEQSHKCEMIEACLRVSYTELKSMHWLTELMAWLIAEHGAGRVLDAQSVWQEVERIARKNATAAYEKLKSEQFRMGTKTPHLLFHYLDYLLWKNNKERFATFEFTFSNSVEHWYPQHPNSNSLVRWDDQYGSTAKLERDQFGNLCVITDSENSTFSNMPPSSKAKYFTGDHQPGSIKYRLMADIMDKLENNGSESSNAQWRKSACADHGRTMLKILEEDLMRHLGD